MIKSTHISMNIVFRRGWLSDITFNQEAVARISLQSVVKHILLPNDE